MKEFKFNISGKEHSAHVVEHEDTLEVTVDGKIYTVTLPERKPAAKPVVKPAVAAAAPAAAPAAAKPAAAPAGGNVVTAPLNGKITQVLVKAGDQVAAGDTVVMLEAMKMENSITAEAAGTVKAVLVNVGDQVDGGQALVELA
ncbi:MAG: acetyl-CoA carboxylase biotin carboxyl carrier protein subunit [Bacteroidaceae bacterium]|nr:acetyl-CoA carboxylase biotin carboxyl carrier protein subunit [Bacteroidaceae bacterium]